MYVVFNGKDIRINSVKEVIADNKQTLLSGVKAIYLALNAFFHDCHEDTKMTTDKLIFVRSCYKHFCKLYSIAFVWHPHIIKDYQALCQLRISCLKQIICSSGGAQCALIKKKIVIIIYIF